MTTHLNQAVLLWTQNPRIAKADIMMRIAELMIPSFHSPIENVTAMMKRAIPQ